MPKNEQLKFGIEKIKLTTGLKQAEIAEKLGIKSTYLSDMINGRVPLTENTCQKIFDLFQISILDDKIEEITFNESPILKEPVLYYGGEKSILLPLIPVEAVAGFPMQDNNGITLSECEQYAVPEFSNKGVEFLIRVSGSSMYPKYSNGDLLACKKVPAITFFQWGKVYVLDTIQGALVKRLFEDKNSPENVLCFSDNKENYPEFTLPKSEIRSLSIVLGVIRME